MSTGSRRDRPQLMAADDRAPSSRLIALGVVVGTHGLRGELRVKQHNLDSELLFDLPEISLRQASALRTVEIASVRIGAKGLLVKLVGIDAIEAAEPLRGAELCVPRSALPPLEEGEFYHVDLEGLAVETPAGVKVGTVENVREYPASEVLRVRGAEGLWEVPMREPYFVSVDLDAGRVVVDHLDDLELER